MQLEEMTLALFAACNGVRLLAYLPQVYKAATDKNGASAISRTTWSLFLVAHLSTIAYALVNRSDPWLALCFTGNALCCLVIVAVAWRKGRCRASPACAGHSAQHLESLKPHPRTMRGGRRMGDECRDFSRPVSCSEGSRGSPGL
jgi:hypothetical protein